jgi:ABC-type dipeptide/oligopeptide/nickel transport system permease subunit
MAASVKQESPALAVGSVNILTFNLVGDGLNEAISSRYQQR